MGAYIKHALLYVRLITARGSGSLFLLDRV
jgi:hypothetical protein